MSERILSKRTNADRLYGALARGGFGLLHRGMAAFGAPQEECSARAGFVAEAAAPVLWLHAASVGETAAALRLVALLRRAGHRFTTAHTSANRAGVEMARRIAAPGDIAALAPWDHPVWVSRALERWQPCALVLVETELWPALVFEASRRRVPVFCASARIYPRDMNRYRLIRPLMAPLLRRLSGILVQSDVERDRFVALGAPPDRCVIAGNLKYVDLERGPRERSPLRVELGLAAAERLVVFGSVHRDEVGFVFAALDRLGHEPLRVMIAPRHDSAIETITRECRKRRWRVGKLSAGPAPNDWQVLILDRVGELARAYEGASVAVVGGGFAKHGGHNPFEPLLVGTPVLLGRHFDHFEAEARALIGATPEARIDDAQALGDRLGAWLTNESTRDLALARQRPVLPDGKAIAQTYEQAISSSIPRSG